MRYLIVALFLALPAFAQTGGLTTKIELAKRLSHPEFASFLKVEADDIREEYAAEATGAATWRLTIRDKIQFHSSDYAAVLRRIEARTDVTELWVSPYVWSAAEGFVRLDHFFSEGEARDEALILISHKLREGIRQKVWSGNIAGPWRERVAQATNPDVAVLANYTLAKGTKPGQAAGITFHFNPGEIAPDGPIALTLPQTLFAEWLNGEGRRVFAGQLTQ